MCVTLNNEVLSVNSSGTDVVLAQFPSSGDLTSFGLTPSIIKTIAIPNDIQEWPSTALNGCTNLEEITTFGMPAKEATIVLSLDHGLRNLTKLTFLRLPSTIQNIGNGFVSDDGSGNVFPRSLQSVSLQDCSSLESIGNYACASCTSLVHIDFSGCTSLRSIERDAFNSCTALVHIDFSGCASLQSIGQATFIGCTSLVQPNLLERTSLQRIGAWAFYKDPLVHIDLSGCHFLQSIDDWAFQNCTQLQTVFLPDSLTTIKQGAFLGTVLKTVYWMGSGPAANIASNAFPSGVEHVYNYIPLTLKGKSQGLFRPLYGF